jgi:eukaryotic-like serine/threonine-protein kinase
MNERDLFMAVLQIEDAAERAAHLGRACAGDTALRQRVDALLAAFEQAGSFLQQPAGDPRATSDVSHSGPSNGSDPAEGPGTVIGPYKLIQQIGEGGMGTVWMAQQSEPVKRLVAVKLIKAGMDSKQVLARFEAERQALALMDHPNIARVLDGGTTGAGRPYFVMDLVKGVPITRYCDAHRLTPRQRLELFVPVCQAVQHAHQKGVIHRDLKPSNVLVALYDGRPVPKVIDFGVAKAAGQPLTDKTLVTGFGSIVGTPEYMSPEQAGVNQLDIDTRSDVHSLGVLLYELLTGTTPFSRLEVAKGDMLEMLRVIREQEPTRPSTKLSTAEGLPTLAANRGTEPAKLTKLIRGELDWVVMKALEKDRNRRYETASAFAADVQRYLHDEPVLACPPSAWYRLRKLARRNKAAFLTAAAVAAAVLLAVGVLVSAVLVLQEEKKQTQEAKEDLERTAYIQRIALAGRELAAGNVGRAEELLDACPEHLRGWEWHFLKRQRYDKAPLLQHSETVGRVAFSPDGGQIASACLEGELAIRDARTGQVLHTLEPQTVVARMHRLVRGMAYSLDGRYLAVARHDGLIHVWDPTKGELLHTLEGHQGASWQVAFSPDSRTLASGGEDRSVCLWDVDSGKALQGFSDHPAAVKAVAFRPDGRSVVAACDDGTVKVWDRGTGRETFSFAAENLAYPTSAWFSPDARRLAWSCLDGVIKVWDTTTGRLELDQQSNTHQCRAVAFSPDGTRIVLAGFDGTLRLLDAVSGKEMLTIFAHPSLVADAVISPDGNKIASASYDHTVRIWDATPLNGEAGPCVTLTGHTQLVSGVAFSPDGRWLASSSWDGTVKLWELSRHAPRDELGTPHAERDGYTLRYTLRGHSGNVSCLAFSPDKRTLASGSWDKTVKLWNLEAPEGDSLAERRLIRLTQRAWSMAFSPDGRLLAVGQQNGIAVYNPDTKKEVHPFKVTAAPIPSVAFSPDNRWLISSGASDPAIGAWAVAGEELSLKIRHHSNPNACAAVSPDGRRLASPARDQAAGEPTVKVWDVDWDAMTPKPFRTLRGHVGYVWKVTFSPDGRYLASGSWDSTVKVWDLEASESAEPVTLRGHAGFIYGLAFSPDGRCLATASGSARHGEVKVWDAALWDKKLGGDR